MKKLQDAWNAIFRKCNYVFQIPNRPTDEEELLKFMRAFVNEKVQSKLAKYKLGKRPSDENTSSDKSLTDSVSKLAVSVELEKTNETEEINDIFKNNSTSKTENQPIQSPGQVEECGYRKALAKAFNAKFQTQTQRWDAMLRLCTVLRKFKTEREGDLNDNHL